MEKVKKGLHKYTLGEELINSITHGIGALLAAIASILLIIKAKNSSLLIFSSVIIYGLSMILTYSVSTIYHSLAPNSGKRVLRVLDHCFIYVIIIGTYAPFTLAGIGGIVGLSVFLVVFTAGVVGISLTAVNMHKFAKFAFVCYLAMGWAIIFAIKPLVKSLDSYGLIMLISGGVAYTLGAALYVIGKKQKYIHSIWHFFVLAGSILHFLAIYNSII